MLATKRLLWVTHAGATIAAFCIAFVIMLVAAIMRSEYVAIIGSVIVGGGFASLLGFIVWIDVHVPDADEICDARRLTRKDKRELERARRRAYILAETTRLESEAGIR